MPLGSNDLQTSTCSDTSVTIKSLRFNVVLCSFQTSLNLYTYWIGSFCFLSDRRRLKKDVKEEKNWSVVGRVNETTEDSQSGVSTQRDTVCGDLAYIFKKPLLYNEPSVFTFLSVVQTLSLQLECALLLLQGAHLTVPAAHQFHPCNIMVQYREKRPILLYIQLNLMWTLLKFILTVQILAVLLSTHYTSFRDIGPNWLWEICP